MNALTISNVETEIDNLAPQIAAVLPPDVPADKFRSVALAAIRNNPDLLRCEPQSLFNACLNAAQDGLMPDGREGAIVPRKGKAVWQAMIQGIYKRVKASGSVATLAANVVYDGETFDVLLGDDDRIVHRRDMSKVAKGAEVAVYAIATLKDGTKEREIMTWEQVQDVRKSSAMPNSGPWTQWADEMARKTVIRRLAKRLPVLDAADEALQRTIGRVDSLYDFGAPAQTIEHSAPDARDALNSEIPVTKQVPLTRAAATTTQRAPRVRAHETTFVPKTGEQWNAWMDDFERTCASLYTRPDLSEYTGRPTVSDVIAAAPAPVRRDIDAILADTFKRLPEEPGADAGASHEREAVA